jgi:hypothetical protein
MLAGDATKKYVFAGSQSDTTLANCNTQNKTSPAELGRQCTGGAAALWSNFPPEKIVRVSQFIRSKNCKTMSVLLCNRGNKIYLK